MSLPDNVTIGCIGLGNMGKAILSGLSGAGINKEFLIGYDKSQMACEAVSDMVTISTSSYEVAQKSDFIILAVKPNIIAKAIEDITSVDKNIFTKKPAISIAAGIKIAQMEKIAGLHSKIVRVMPNTPALINQGMSVLSYNKNVNIEEIKIINSIFAVIGKTLTVDEKNMDAVTAISGCGPAYVFTFIQAMTDAGVKLGLSRNDSLTLACQTIKGSAEMTASSNLDPISLRNMVTSPGGSTIAAVHVLERSAFSGIIMDAVTEAAKVTKSLGENK